MKINKLILLIPLIISLAAGCAHHPAPITIENAATYQRQLSKLQQWTLEAKIAIRHSNTSDSGALRWEQSGERFDIFVSGPLGVGATRLSGTPQKMTLENNSSESTTTEDPGHLMEKHLGWELPLAELPRWILGQHGSTPDVRYHADHTAEGFTANNWQVEYLRYTEVETWKLPEKIRLTHEDLQVTLLIKRWELR